ncbi:unannotated protein [freshwater metagenome]|uniref:Unannotated protein n=1 Tax=freshwater metagenome TaxID=449393 RepID=A0A6J6YXU5_9ZZZZ
MPILRRTSSGFISTSVMSFPSNLITPSSIGSNRFMQRSNVDLPEPDAPINTVAVCSGTFIEISSSTTSVSNDLRNLEISRTDWLMPVPAHFVAQSIYEVCDL